MEKLTPEGGTHRRGFYTGLHQSVKQQYKKSLLWTQLERGLTMIVGILHPAPAFESPTKVKLYNPEVEQQTARVVKESPAFRSKGASVRTCWIMMLT